MFLSYIVSELDSTRHIVSQPERTTGTAQSSVPVGRQEEKARPEPVVVECSMLVRQSLVGGRGTIWSYASLICSLLWSCRPMQNTGENCIRMLGGMECGRLGASAASYSDHRQQQTASFRIHWITRTDRQPPPKTTDRQHQCNSGSGASLVLGTPNKPSTFTNAEQCPLSAMYCLICCSDMRWKSGRRRGLITYLKSM